MLKFITPSGNNLIWYLLRGTKTYRHSEENNSAYASETFTSLRARTEHSACNHDMKSAWRKVQAIFIRGLERLEIHSYYAY